MILFLIFHVNTSIYFVFVLPFDWPLTDKALRPRAAALPKEILPRAIVIDMSYVRLTDVTGLTALSEAMTDCRKKKVHIALINMTRGVEAEISKFGIRSEDMEDADGQYLQQFIVPAEDGRMYVRYQNDNNNKKVTKLFNTR